MPAADGMRGLIPRREIRMLLSDINGGRSRGRRMHMCGYGCLSRYRIMLIRERAVIARESVLLAVLLMRGAFYGVFAPLPEVVPFVDDAQPGYDKALPGIDEGDGTLTKELFGVFCRAVVFGSQLFLWLCSEGGFTKAPFEQSNEGSKSQCD